MTIDGNTLSALTAILVFLVTVAALGAEQTWWFLAPLIGFVVLVPMVYFLTRTEQSAEATPSAR